MRYKYVLGQKVLAHISGKNWDEEYEVPSTIIGLEDYVENGVPVYSVRTHYGKIIAMNEKNLKVDKEEKK